MNPFINYNNLFNRFNMLLSYQYPIFSEFLFNILIRHNHPSINSIAFQMNILTFPLPLPIDSTAKASILSASATKAGESFCLKTYCEFGADSPIKILFSQQHMLAFHFHS